MAIALTLERYLDTKHVKYDVIAHEPTNSSMQTAQACHIPGDRLAKAVVLRDEVGVRPSGIAGVAPHSALGAQKAVRR